MMLVWDLEGKNLYFAPIEVPVTPREAPAPPATK